MTQGIDETFSARMRELRQQAVQLYKSVQGSSQRMWQVPAVQSTSPLAVSQLHSPAFDRTALNNDYDALVAGKSAENSNGAVLALRLQLAAVAVEERAYRHRHMSVARAICTAHGMCYGQGEGALFGPTGIEGDAAAYMRAGAVSTTIRDLPAGNGGNIA